MKALIRSAATVASHVRLGNHDLVFDQPTAVPGGEDHGPSPLDVLVVSVGACAHYFASAYLYGRGIPANDLTVEVEAMKDQVPTPRLGTLAIRVRVPAGLTDRQLEGVEKAIRRCPAYGTLVSPPAIDLTVERQANTGEQRQSA